MTTPDLLERLRDQVVTPADDPTFQSAVESATELWAGRAKPPGSLGKLESLGALVAGITGTVPPRPPTAPAVLVFAADHGVVADGASAWPSDVTGFMVRGMAEGGAAINALATTVGAMLMLVDVGVDADLSDVSGLVHHKIRPGTDSLASGPAMSRTDALGAIFVGAEVTARCIDAGADLIAGGDMGIGNTTPSAALIAWKLGLAPAHVGRLIGPGAGSDDHGIERKTDIVAGALGRLGPDEDPVDVLASIGGLEIAALVGCYLEAVARNVPVIIDGVIACAALCVAEAIAPGVSQRVIAGHRSTEPAATAALEHLGLDPLLDLGLRLGEGTGACLAIPIVQAACRALCEMADLPG